MKLALGSAQFGLDYGIVSQQARLSSAEAAAIVKFARENGISTLDTAIDYGDAEQRLGELGVSDWQTISKLPALPEECDDIEQWVRQQVTGSLQRLGNERLYGLLLHRPMQLLDVNGNRLYNALQQVRQEGLVSKIGISIYAPSELDSLCRHYRFDLVQAPFSVLDRRVLTSGWMSRLYAQGIEFHVRSIFLQGLLLMEAEQRPPYFTRWSDIWTRFSEWLKLHKLTPLEACLGFALSFEEIARVVVGVASLQQLDDIVQAARVSVSPLPDAINCEDPDLVDPLRWIGNV